MKKETQARLEEAMRRCAAEDRSATYMIQYMQDFAEVPYDCVIRFLEKYTGRPERLADTGKE